MKNMYVSWALCVMAACSIKALLLKPKILTSLLPPNLLSLENGPVALQIFNYLMGDITNTADLLLNPPENKNDSLKYKVYTKRNPEKPCFLVLTQESLEECQIDPNDKLVLFAPGFTEKLRPGNLFEVIKDKILANGPFTVIILDWTKYNQPPVTLAVKNMLAIGPLAADVLKFIIKNAGVKAENMILTGHSLGAGLVGRIARNVPNIGRLDGLDPNFVISNTFPYEKTDAKFVRVMHTSIGFGTIRAVGDVDFYVNGGSLQPHCTLGNRYQRTSGDFVTIDSLFLKFACDHESAVMYYLYSVNSTDCQFLGTHCNSYADFQAGKCSPKDSTVANMGFYGEDVSVSGLPKKTEFYLNTSAAPPYCLKTGSKR